MPDSAPDALVEALGDEELADWAIGCACGQHGWEAAATTAVESYRGGLKQRIAAALRPVGRGAEVARRLTEAQADEIEAEMRRLEVAPSVTKRALRLFMQAPMPCGHAAGNLLTCDRPPIGCVICGEPRLYPDMPPAPKAGEEGR